jgi:hypothetical protein
MSPRTVNIIAIVMLLIAVGVIGAAVYSSSQMTAERDPLELLHSDETPDTPDPPKPVGPPAPEPTTEPETAAELESRRPEERFSDVPAPKE